MPDETRARRWRTYLRERSPLPMVLGIGAAQAVSGHSLVRSGFDARSITTCAIGIAALLVLLRLMDEIKDLAKDRIAHPERPLPRGLLAPDDVRRAIRLLGGALLAYAALVGAAFTPIAGVLFALTVGYAFLMYREFFLPRLVNRDAWVYAITHQVIILPMYAFAVAIASPHEAIAARTLWFALTGLGASFAVEVSRKLDPAAHPILETYLQRYGRTAVTVAVVAALALLGVSAHRVDVQWIVWPFIALTLVTLPLLFLRPGRFKVIEGAAALLAMVQMLAPSLHRAWSALR